MEDYNKKHRRLAIQAAKRMATTSRPKQTASTCIKHLIAVVRSAKGGVRHG